MSGESKHSRCSIVVAFDVGTSLSGYAWALVRGEKKVNWDQKWPGSKNPSPKTMTAILMKPNGAVVSFGEKALRDYLDSDEKTKSQLLFFRNFKMCLNGELHKQPELEALNGQKLKAVDVFAAFIGCLRQCALTRLREVSKSKTLVEANDILFVVTLPAIWSEGAKQIMREGAE